MLNYDRNVTDFRPIEGHRAGVDLLRDRVSPVGKKCNVQTRFWDTAKLLTGSILLEQT